MKLTRIWLFNIFCTAMLCACAGSGHKIPDITRMDVTSVNQELQADHKPLAVYNRSDTAYQSLVNKVNNKLLRGARKLCDHTGYERCFFQTVYDPGNEANAYASEGHKITVYRGLLQYLGSEEEIAAVVAHEMGHHLANHNEEKTQNARVGAVVSGVLTAVVLGAANANNPYYSQQQNEMNTKTVQDMTQLGAHIGSISYSKEEESEADLLGAYLMARSGYNLKKAEQIFVVMAKLPGAAEDGRSSLLDSHPAGPERLATWRKVEQEIKNNKTKLPYAEDEGK